MQFVSHPAVPVKRIKRKSNETVDTSVNISIRKIHIAPILPSMKLSSVVQYFENFGVIENTQFCLDQRFGYGVVQFKSAESAHVILQKRYHGIAKHAVTVQPANDQPIESTSNQVFPTVSPQICDVSDECLMKIFENLDEFGLCAVAKTSTRFKRVAEQTFLHSKKFDKIELEQCNGSYEANKALFQTFSPLVTDLRIDFRQHDDENLIKCLATHPCDNLKTLDLYLEGNSVANHRLKDCIKLPLKRIFSKLHHLDFSNHFFFDSETSKELLSSCAELKSIAISSSDICKNITFPSLQKLQLLEFNDEELETVFAFNRDISKLEFFGCEEFTSKVFTSITSFLPNLKEVSFGYSSFEHGANIRQLTKLKHLKTLKIRDETALPVFNVFYEAKIPIEHLVLDIDANVAILEKVFTMKTIKRLELERIDVDDKYLKLIAEHLPNLAVLCLSFVDNVTIGGLERFIFHAKYLIFLDLYHLENVKESDKQRLHDFIGQHFEGRDITIQVKGWE